MSKTILVPTDFSVESLNLVKQAIEDHADEKINLLVVHGIDAASSVTDLLFFSKNTFLKKLLNEDFKEACDIIRNRFDKQLNSFRLDLFTGLTQNAFNTYLEANQVEKIYAPQTYKFKLDKKMSVDITKFIKKNKNVSKIDVEWAPYFESRNSSVIAQLFQVS